MNKKSLPASRPAIRRTTRTVRIVGARARQARPYICMPERVSKPAAKPVAKPAAKASKPTAKSAKSLKPAAKAPRTPAKKRPVAPKSAPPKKPATKPVTKPIDHPRTALIVIIAASALSVAVALIASYAFNPERDAKNALVRLADDYYIEYLYPATLGSNLETPSSILPYYTETGLPAVRLRQLLRRTPETYDRFASFFSNNYYHCDTNLTSLRFFPVSPYGPRDYTVEYHYACEDFTSLD